MKLASIERIKEIIKHPNADSLSIVTVLGYQAIVKLDQYKVGDLVIFIQPDTVLPDAPWAAFYKAKSNRVKSIRLRKVWSQGIVESLSILPVDRADAEGHNIYEGSEISGILGVTKYEPPLPQDLSARGCLPFQLCRTDEERVQNLDNIPYGELCDVTLKIDGSSLSLYCKLIDNQWVTGVTSRSLDLKLDCENKYTIAANKFLLITKLKSYCESNNVNLALRGELYGNNIQGFALNPHAKKELGFAAYSIFNLDTLKYEGIESPHYYRRVCEKLDIETVPLIEENVILTPELIKKYDEGIEVLNGQPFEGVVIKLKDGKSFKVINKHYDSKK